MAMTVAIGSFHQDLERASHQAIGTPTTSRITVVSVANSIVRRIAVQVSGERADTASSAPGVDDVAVFFDDAAGLGALKEA